MPRGSSHGSPRLHGDSRPSIAIVVPVREDKPWIVALLKRVLEWNDSPDEVVIVSASTDRDLRALCEANGYRYLRSEPCRGGQMDTGARAAGADVVWFLHADSAPAPDCMGEIRRAVADGAEGGHFRFLFSGKPTWRKAILARLVNLRVALGGIPYGDQGIFVRREVYLRCGGFPHQPLFEEVALVRELRSGGRFQSLASQVGVSPRRWDSDGWIRRSLGNRWLALAYSCGRAARDLADRYGPPETRSASPPGRGPQP